MDRTLPLPSSSTDSDAEDAKVLRAAISECFAEMDTLREEMRRSDASIVASGNRTDAVLAEITRMLAEMKTAA